MASSEKDRIVFFDGACGLCNLFVDFLLKIDGTNGLYFAPLQGTTIHKYVSDFESANTKTVIFYSQGAVYLKSDAVIEIFKSIGGFWYFAVIFSFIPKKLRDYIYDVIALNRHKWFGSNESCRAAAEKEKAKFLE